MSFPFGHSVNDEINKDEFTLTYSKESDAISLIINAGHVALMGKVDIKSANRIIPVHPSDRHLLGMFWQGDYYPDLALPFGLRSAPAIFNSLADLLHWCLFNSWNVLDLLHYLDDYFGLVENAGTRVCGYADMRVCGYAGMRICGYAGMRICGYADMRVCGYAGMRICGYADMRICGYAGTSNWFNNKQISKTH